LPAVRATFWEYGTNGWAVAQCGGGNSGPPAGIGSPEDRLNRQVALTADFATAPQLRSPVAFGYLPDGLEVAQISRFSGASNGVQINLVRRSAARPEVISLAFEWPPTIPASPGQVVNINGRQAKIVNGNSLTINFEGYGPAQVGLP
jgi:hypothetical protein